jgi:hypothetical protein
MYPHERSLVQRLQNKPFALIGVNSDDTLDEVKTAMTREQITWRSFWPAGPIARQWRVQAWPTIYIIDARGVIRYRNLFGPALDKAVDELLKEI